MNKELYVEKYRGKRWSRERVEDALAVYLPGWSIREPEWVPANGEDKAPLCCPEGHSVDRFVRDLAKDCGCRECKDEHVRREMANRFIAALEADGYTALFGVEDYVNSHQNLPTVCPAGNEYDTTSASFVNNCRRCKCSGCWSARGPRKRTKWTPESITAALLERGLEALEEPRGVMGRIRISCLAPGCGWEGVRMPQEYLYGRGSCPRCAGREKGSTDSYREELRKKGWDLPEGVGYVMSQTLIPHICPEGHVTLKSPDAWRQGRGCRECKNEGQSRRTRGVNLVTGDKLTAEELAELEESRRSSEYRRWRRNVLARDNERCVLCGSTREPQAHHLFSFAKYRDYRYEEGNGVTLCARHHLSRYEGSFHAVHGQDGRSVPGQFLEYLDNYIANNPDADKGRLFYVRKKVERLIERVECAEIQKEAV
ncbi:HNH endonuclease [Paludifilum halophilum]|uniref:HNH nuclease domain-containing protein n=1 Tax=Paludifilum halophilum TaxID=1642702 RepID=A0A235B884_9BACL|nr:hypothetical protein [Paludifilum halophilum]OYD08520.1 hypothetical protein CHM34_06755 [Paludifilum halophilum]